jgi:hypothetical protein
MVVLIGTVCYVVSFILLISTYSCRFCSAAGPIHDTENTWSFGSFYNVFWTQDSLLPCFNIVQVEICMSETNNVYL